MAIKLGDDGTLDTVVYCDECRQEWRGNYDGPIESQTAEQVESDYQAWVQEFIDETADDHGDCTEPSGR